MLLLNPAVHASKSDDPSHLLLLTSALAQMQGMSMACLVPLGKESLSLTCNFSPAVAEEKMDMLSRARTRLRRAPECASTEATARMGVRTMHAQAAGCLADVEVMYMLNG